MAIPILKKSNKNRDFKMYTDSQINACVYGYLFNGNTTLWQDENILGLDSNISKGIKARNILHYLGINKEFKGLFKELSADNAISKLMDENQDFDEIIIRIKRHLGLAKPKYPQYFSSWTLESSTVISKELDKSAFQCNGSAIPTGIRGSFGIKQKKLENIKKLQLVMDNETYDAKIIPDKQERPRYRIFWSSKLTKRIKEIFPNHYILAKEGRIQDSNFRPKIFFETIGESKYKITFSELEYSSEYITAEEYNDNIIRKVKLSLSDTRDKRQKRLEKAESKATAISVKTTVYRRNPDVVAEVLSRANGICERCGKEAPFNRATDGTPYLEVHHTIPLSNGGDDTVDNAMGVCPNCHRELHFG